ncbi:MAG: type II toxin-antitoxin system prevent-host-death family antitoxin [Acidobacteriota bacterium]|nr:type II toxin-antitoxin system prevent-host-death family antitoxin [Acidobacteriota bacterium]
MADVEKITVSEARKRLSHLLDSVALGREIVIVRRGRPVACLTAVRESGWSGFPDRGALRASLSKSARGIPDSVRKLRDSERF